MELRKDYILDRWVYFAESRKDRPKEYPGGKEPISGSCNFCAGHEESTPAEIGRIGDKKSWDIRWIPNKFPAVVEECNPDVSTDNTFFTYAQAYGRHEVIIESPVHTEQLWDFGVQKLSTLLKVYNRRVGELLNMNNIGYVSLFKNHGKEAGASLVHSHTQLVALSMVPRAVHEKAVASRNFGSCPHCRIIQVEKQSSRRCFENASFVAFTPYSSRFNYELWVYPKAHIKTFGELNNAQIDDLAQILQKVLAKLKQINAPYNILMVNSPRGDNLHAHIEITPRTGIWAGLELGTETYINSILPEYAASFYRGEI